MPQEPDEEEIGAQQADFARCLLATGEPVPATLAGGGSGEPPVRRFGVHRNNVVASLAAVVSARYPVILRLLGEEFFKGLASAFVRCHPPSAPVLSQYGGEFPGFIENFAPARDLPYLADVARIEWAMHVAYHAADREPLAAADLSAVPGPSIAGMRLMLHPSAALVVSPFPAVSIWETNSFDDEVQPIGPDLPGEQALVVRPALDVGLVRLTPAGFTLAKSIAAGLTVGEAFDAASRLAPEAELSEALAAIVTAGAIVDAEFDAPARGRALLSSIDEVQTGSRAR